MEESPEKLNRQAFEFASHGEYEEAIACLKKAIEIEKYNYLLWFNLGVIYRDAGKLEESISALLQANKINDEDEDVIETIALVYFSLGDIEQALYYCKEGLGLNFMNAHIWNTLGVIFFNQDDYEMAADSFEHAITINPYYYDALYNLRDTYDELGNEVGKRQIIEQMKNVSESGKQNA